MKLWMDVMRTLEPVLDDHERLFDAWAAGGVDGLVIGPLLFDQPKLYPGVRWESGKQPQATFDPDPAVYRRFGVEAPAAPATVPEKRRQLEQTLTAAKNRGWSVWIFQASAGAGPGGEGHIFADERTQAAVCARMVDTLIDQAQRAKDRDAALTRGLKELGEGSDRQTQVLGLVQQQLDLHSETSSRVAEILGEARTALGAFSATSERHARSIESLAEATRRRTIQSDRLERRLQLWLVVTTALSTTALVYALVVALRDAPQPQPATVPVTPVVVTEPATTNGTEPAAATQATAPTGNNGNAAAASNAKPPVTVPDATSTGSSGTAPDEPATVDPIAPGALRGGWSEPIEP